MTSAGPSNMSVVKEIVEMSEKSGDQSALLYATMSAVVVLGGVIGILWRKWEVSRKNLKLAAEKRETLIEKHANQIDSIRATHALEIKELNRENHRVSEKLTEIMIELKATR